MLESLFNKIAGRPATLFQPRPKIDLNTGDPVKIAKFLRAAFSMEHLLWLLLSD